MTFADVFQSLNATLHNRGRTPARCTVGLYWTNTAPSEITLSIRSGEEYAVWSVARSILIGAEFDGLRGSWVGGGDFAACYAGERIMLAFKPRATNDHAVMILPADPVREWVNHTIRITPPADETDANMTQVDAALEHIFGMGEQ